jgi:glycosyltransferase involved in cell wall biosynthesis
MIAIVIPAYKPSDGLVAMLQNIRTAYAERPIIVVDDGGGEMYRAVFDRLREISGVVILVNAVNLGKGAALKRAINHALVAFPHIMGVVCADADGQHTIEDIGRVAEQLAKKPDHLILGARVFDKTTPIRSKVGNEISRIVYRLVLGIKLRDTQTGLRGLPLRLCRESLAIRSNSYDFETEQLSICRRLGLPIEEVTIKTVYEDDNASSHFNPIFDSAKIYFALLRYGASSVATAAVDLLAFIVLSPFIPNVVANNLASRAVALCIQFFLLRSFVFHTKAGIVRFMLFGVYVAVTGVVSGVLQSAMSANLGVPLVPAKLIADLGIFIFNFLFLRDILFAKPRPLLTAPNEI